MIKAVIFDCDGTLVDSEEAHFLSWQRSVRNWGADLDLTSETYRSYAGKPGDVISKSLAQSMQKDCADQLFADKREYFLEYVHRGLPPIAATVDFVRRLAREKKRLDIKLAVASATVKQEILLNLRQLGISDLFDVVLSGHEDLHFYSDPEGVNKPKPYIYLHTAKLLGVLASECAVIEDSSTGVSSACRAGCFTVAIPNAYTKQQDLSEASLQLETLADLSVDQFISLCNRTP